MRENTQPWSERPQNLRPRAPTEVAPPPAVDFEREKRDAEQLKKLMEKFESEVVRGPVPASVDQIRPDHYGGPDDPFEPVKIIHAKNLNFNLGNVIKYVLRAGLKGDAIEDLKKALTYLQFEIDRRSKE
ncbi:MAG: DUF3310 domain-containing protein [Planctomycetota bacterium]|nr:DUF3310 domain-containing protein [Planctomycetota bacterium]